VDLVLRNLSEPIGVSTSRSCQFRSDSAVDGGQSSYISDSEEFGFSCNHRDEECTSAVDAIRSARSIYDQRDKDFAEKGEVEGIVDSFREIFQADSSVEDEALLEECEKHFERQECQKPRFSFKSFWTSKKQEGCDHSSSGLPVVPEDSTLVMLKGFLDLTVLARRRWSSFPDSVRNGPDMPSGRNQSLGSLYRRSFGPIDC